jgi:hypothetical protein
VSREDLLKAFADGFVDEIEKTSDLLGGIWNAVKSPWSLAPAAVTGGMMGLGALMKPSNQSWRQWMPSGTAGRTFGALSTFGLSELGGGASPLKFRPPSISGMSLGGMMGQQTAGSF